MLPAKCLRNVGPFWNLMLLGFQTQVLWSLKCSIWANTTYTMTYKIYVAKARSNGGCLRIACILQYELVVVLAQHAPSQTAEATCMASAWLTCTDIGKLTPEYVEIGSLFRMPGKMAVAQFGLLAVPMNLHVQSGAILPPSSVPTLWLQGSQKVAATIASAQQDVAVCSVFPLPGSDDCSLTSFLVKCQWSPLQQADRQQPWRARSGKK